MISDLQLRKCVSIEQQLVDRISQFPDDILVHILSFLTLEDAARTTVLSKRWVGLWMHVAGLNFEASKLLEGIEGMDDRLEYRRFLPSIREKYIKWVNKILLSHKATFLDMFRIRFDLNRSSKNDIDKWLQYAFSRRVCRLDLDLLPYGSYVSLSLGKSYGFHLDLLGLSDGSSSAVSASHSCGNDINSDVFFGFKSLRALTFNNVNVSGPVLEFFLHNCPLLEHLVVASAGYLEQLKVCGQHLAVKHLEIVYCPKLLSLTVCDTNIVSLKFDKGELLVLKNVPKLVDVYVTGFCLQNCVSNTLSWLSCCLSKLQMLSLDICNAQLFDVEDIEAVVPQLTTLKQLTFFQYMPWDVSLSPFTSLIRASPNLEKFVLKTDRMGGIEADRSFPLDLTCREPPRVAFPLRHLKVVEICGYFGHKRREVALVEYLVENGVVLERIIIDPRDQPLHGQNEGRPLDDPAMYRNLAKQQLQALIPSHVEFVLL